MAVRLSFVLLASLLVKDVYSLSVSVQPRQQIAKIGDKITVICRVGDPIEYCMFDIPSEPSLSLKPNNAPYKSIRYSGEGLQHGVCGLEMIVENKHNGILTCSVTPAGQSVSTKANSTLIVARKPNAPEMSITNPRIGKAYMEEEQITAKCEVKNGRPAANITWFIGDTKITDGLSSPTEQVSPAESLFTVTQTLTRKLRASDNGKPLKCIAGHLLLTEKDNQVIRQLTVFFPPKPSPEPLEHFGLVEGEEGKITVTVIANPRPSLTWKIGEERIHEDETDQTGRFKVLRATENPLKGAGYWESVLVITPLEKEDVEREYVLTAGNTYGNQTYKVAISTNPEPRMLELGAGTIVSIVVVILLILIVASILVFARAKGRWCFAGKSAVRSAGESSDTESAEHHHATGPKAKMTFTKVFKKKGDKVATENEQAKDVTAVDEKNVSAAPKEEVPPADLNKKADEEGVVYAELDLQHSSPAARPVVVRPEDDKTEYAEIVHTQNNNK